MVLNTALSIEDFEAYIHQSDNLDKSFEYISGEIIEVVSNNYSSQIAIEIAFQIKLHMKTQHINGHVTGADGGYEIGNERYIPDVGYISATRQPQPNQSAYNPLAPDLAVEVISPTDDAQKLRLKIANYLSAHVVVWVVNPEDQTVEIYRPGEPAQMRNHTQSLDGSPVFPNFTIAVKELFPARHDKDDA